MLNGSKRNACSRLPVTATTIEGRSISSGSRRASRRSGWNSTSRCGPASISCQPFLSSGIVCCMRGCSITHLPFNLACCRVLLFRNGLEKGCRGHWGRYEVAKSRALFWREKSPNHQKNDRADDGSDQPCPFASLIPTDGLAEVGGGKRPNDAEDELGNDPGYETNDDGPKDVPHGGCLHAGSGEPIL